MRRVLWTIPVLLLFILFTFLLVRAIATGPFSPENAPPAVQSKFHLDKPWYEQYAFYVKGVFTLDLGPSRVFPGRTVNDIIAKQYPNSLLLGLLALAWAFAIGIPAGLIAALRPRSLLDYAVMGLSTVGFAFPNFLVATLLIYYFSVKLGWFPTSGWPSEHWELDRRQTTLRSTGQRMRLLRWPPRSCNHQEMVGTRRSVPKVDQLRASLVLGSRAK